jgi:hypothetical protein
VKSAATNGWGIWSRHGTVILYVAARPGSSVADIACGLNLTQRTIRDIVADLRRVEMLNVSRRGRRLLFTVNLDAKFRHPTIKDVSLQTLVGGLMAVRAPAAAEPLLAVVSH